MKLRNHITKYWPKQKFFDTRYYLKREPISEVASLLVVEYESHNTPAQSCKYSDIVKPRPLCHTAVAYFMHDQLDFFHTSRFSSISSFFLCGYVM